MPHFAKQTTMKHGCIIMASGMGTRFGGNKLMAKLNGIPLIQYVIQATESRFEQRVVVTRHNDVTKLCHELDVAVALHKKPHRNDTVRLGMDAIGKCDTVTFFQADQPLISPSSITALLCAAENTPEYIWRASFEGAPSAPVLFPSWTFDELRTLPSGKGGGYVAKHHKELVRCIEVSSRWELFDVDTPADLILLQKHLGL